MKLIKHVQNSYLFLVISLSDVLLFDLKTVYINHNRPANC